MNHNLRIQDLKSILRYYHRKTPTNIFQVKKKANKLIVSKLCVSNCDYEGKYKRLFFILNKKRMISHQKKIKHEKTRKYRICLLNQTRMRSPISYFDA